MVCNLQVLVSLFLRLPSLCFIDDALVLKCLYNPLMNPSPPLPPLKRMLREESVECLHFLYVSKDEIGT